jgi:lipopolysaccharide/colanic/teichoic acid biosynthesis glycosyltransferase
VKLVGARETSAATSEASAVLTPSRPSPHFAYHATKRVIDVVVATLLLIVLAPLLLVIAIAIKFDSRGPILFRQQRVGSDELPFMMLKFRSMRDGAESEVSSVRHLDITNGPTFKAPKDPRLTRVGRRLRRFSLDELPQLVNVLRGDMSLVGPRPMLAQELLQMEPGYRRRFLAKPGLTCIWQVSGRSEIEFARWMELDVEYVERRSLRYDLALLARTPIAVLNGRGAY